MKTIIVVFFIMLTSLCSESKEKIALQNSGDSLKLELMAINAGLGLKEVDALIDSIDASRYLLQLKIIEGNDYADYVSRLKGINILIKRTEVKIKILEESNRKSSKVAVSIIRQLREDLENRTRELISHQLQVASLNKTNLELLAAAHEKDSILIMKDQLLKAKERDIANLTRMNVEARENSQITIANLYFAQAVALEQVASRTQFAPNKKKAARRDAHELYKLALSLGNQNAQVRIADLEGN